MSSPSSKRTRTRKQATFLLVRVLAVAGFAISAYLFFLKMTGEISSLKGCGGSEGCENVLGSKWSQWFHVPVSGLSAIFYLGVIGMTFKPSRNLLATVALVLIGAAMWFMGLQVVVIKSFCPWCFATHLIGVLTAIAILRTIKSSSRPVSYPACASFALAPLLILAAGQVYGPEPDTHKIVENKGGQNSPIHSGSEGRLVKFGDKEFDTTKLPIIGSPDAEHILVKYFDYTCGSCRDLEGDLEKLMEKHPGKFAIIVLPTPMNRKCNVYLRSDIKDHPGACELAKLGMAAWLSQPESFPEIHKFLFSRPVLAPEQALEKITEIIPRDKFKAGLEDPWIDKLIRANTDDYSSLAVLNIKMPKLLVKDSKVLEGVARSATLFIKDVEDALGL